MKRPFHEILKSLREDHGLSQQELADALQIKRSALGNYEIGLRFPNPEIMDAIADYFNVDMDYLYGRTDIKNRYQQSHSQIEDTEYVPETIAAHFEGKEFTDEDLDDIARFIDFVASKKRGGS